MTPMNHYSTQRIGLFPNRLYEGNVGVGYVRENDEGSARVMASNWNGHWARCWRSTCPCQMEPTIA
jgi:hypothetical protein